MKLSTQLMVAMVGLVVGTAAAGLIGYRGVESAVVPVNLERLRMQASGRLAILDIYLRDTRGDVLALRAVPAHDRLMRTIAGNGLDADEQTAEAKWRADVEGIYAGLLNAKPAIREISLIGIADRGREIIRVDRGGPGRAARVARPAERRTEGDRDYFRETFARQPGEAYVSPIVLARRDGVIAEPHTPVVRVATVIQDGAGQPIAIIVINLDVRPMFEALCAAVDDHSQVYIVNAAGDFLMHPDQSRVFGFDLGARYRWQDEFPALVTQVGDGDQGAAVIDRIGGEKVAVAIDTRRLADSLRVGIIETASYAGIMAPATALRQSDLTAAAASIAVAILLAILMARSLTRPLRQITGAVTGFGRGEPIHVPDRAGGEVGILVQAFKQMAAEVTNKADALRNKSEILDKTIESMADGFLIIDEEGAVVFANAVCREMFGIETGLGHDTWNERNLRFQPDGITPMPFNLTPVGRAMRGESFDNVEVAHRTIGETRLTRLAASGRILSGELGKMEGAVIVYRDLTAFRETEHQLHQSLKMEAIGQLTGGIAHDFNNTLTVITGAIEIIAEGIADRPELHMVAMMVDEAVDRGAELTHQLLSFARRQPLVPREIDVNEMVLNALRLLRPTIGERVQLESRLADSMWTAMADPAQLLSALLNLAVNARDAMPSGGRLTLETASVVIDQAYAEHHAEVTAGSYAMIAVSDNGHGIPAAILDRVFDPFFTTKAIGKGTGLGLSMVFGFIKQSGGHIKIYSEEGYGTTIKLYLPRADGTTAAAPPEQAPDIVGGRETVLVVEDDELVRRFVISSLVSLGYQIYTAASAAEALEMVRQGLAFDVLFTDVVLGTGLNGRQLAEQMERIRPGVKVLYTSGYTENAIVQQARLDAGIHLLTKPYRRAELAKALREVLDAAIEEVK
jgi:signal transduction histidine kinase/ActR/RegA family two-component response regulator